MLELLLLLSGAAGTAEREDKAGEGVESRMLLRPHRVRTVHGDLLRVEDAQI